MPAGRVAFPEGTERRERPLPPRLLCGYRRGATHAIGMVRVIRQNQQQFVLYQLRHGQFLPGRADQWLIVVWQLCKRPLVADHAKPYRGLKGQREWLKAALATHDNRARSAAAEYQPLARKYLPGKRNLNLTGRVFKDFAQPLQTGQRQGSCDLAAGSGPVVGVN